MEEKYLGMTANGFDVFYDMEKSHAITHFAHNPNLINFVIAVIEEMEPEGDQVRVEKDMGEMVGTDSLVETSPEDEVVYAKRPLRTTYTRFVKNKEPLETSWITIDLRKSAGSSYHLYTAFAGRITPSFPGGEYLPEQSKEFWSKHALVWGSQEIVSGTESTKCPW